MWDNFINGFMGQITPQVWQLIGLSTYETIYMSFAATVFAIAFGLPLGIWTFLTQQNQALASPKINRVLEAIINIGRSIPFIILLFDLMPVTRFLVGTTLGTTASIIPLGVAAMPFFARLTSNALGDIPSGLTETAKAMGTTVWQLVTKFYLPEALPMLIKATTLTLVTLIGYSAMAGAVGGGGLGNTAISYGLHRNMPYVLWVATIILVLIVMICERYGNKLADHFDHR
ncbi:ABC transporter permease [Lonepinella koalarum]|uniref:D-methionine transport system permease protein n=1 Tax=Lonepinella koalarum TaxID=53417 RepID=A0A4R1KJS0_9PAST|nr:methionine ABC transporter permease [Lonepinella koalarum]MDH2927374.1 methionine ABC transporter permease [Lonepinella koalarum]TCK64994.1 D-methionine transport system permease protein [Lonepinella koalarum]TFJ88889.1 ABC transporter permease [Lonepinella koalarum]TYG35550.1 ABC transporter permease [Lonepinella koalarum]